MGGPVTNDQWKQATLPVSLGGLGFRSALLNSPGAFLRSLIDSSQIMEDILGEQNKFQDQDLVDLINSYTGENEFCLEEAVNSSQKVISHAVESNLAKELMDGATSEREKARLNAVSLKHSGDWLNAVPVKALGLHIHSQEFAVALKYRLGVPVYPSSGPCRACTTTESDVYGDHALGCSSEGTRIFRHNSLRDVVHATAQQAHLNPAKEESALLPESGGRPADVYLPGWSSGKDTALDIAVVSPLQALLVKKAAEEAGSAACKRYKDKLTKYLHPCEQEGIQFIPVVVETMGGWHPESASVLTKLSRQLSAQTGVSFEETTRHFFQRLSITLVKGNSSLIMRRMPTCTDARVDGDVDQ